MSNGNTKSNRSHRIYPLLLTGIGFLGGSLIGVLIGLQLQNELAVVTSYIVGSVGGVCLSHLVANSVGARREKEHGASEIASSEDDLSTND